MSDKLTFLYIFPHPDDESFGPSGAIAQQLKDGHEVHLLTLTKGEATSVRAKLGVSKKEMGEIRFKEMLAVKEVLNLHSMDVLDYPDNQLAELDPRDIEKTVEEYIRKLNPHIVVSYPVHGVSGFFDHLVMHAVVKRVFLELREQSGLNLKRLAFITLPDKGLPAFMDDGTARIKNSPFSSIDCIIKLSEYEIEKMKQCFDCYVTYQGKIAESKVIEKIGSKLYFEIYGESFDPPLTKLEEKLG